MWPYVQTIDHSTVTKMTRVRKSDYLTRNSAVTDEPVRRGTFTETNLPPNKLCIWDKMTTKQTKLTTFATVHRTQKVLKKSRSGHHHTTLSGYIFATKAHIDNRKKKLVKQQYVPKCPHNMVNIGPLTTEIGPVVWGTAADFNGFRVLAALLQGTPAVGISQSLRRWTQGATYIRQGGHHVGDRSTFWFLQFLMFLFERRFYICC